MENRKEKNIRIWGILGSITSVIGLLVGIISIGTNSFYLKNKEKECDIQKINDLEILIDYANKENIHSLLEAVKYETEADYIYCKNYNKLFNNKEDLKEIKLKYQQAKEEYERLRKRNEDLEKEIRQLNQKLNLQIQELDSELLNNNRPGKGPKYQKIKEQNQKYQVELDSLKNKYVQQEEFFEKSLSKINLKLDKVE